MSLPKPRFFASDTESHVGGRCLLIHYRNIDGVILISVKYKMLQKQDLNKSIKMPGPDCSPWASICKMDQIIQDQTPERIIMMSK
nr:hypothetical protein CFP56_44675 [Quercus suber]